jgi:hypothetical protein
VRIQEGVPDGQLAEEVVAAPSHVQFGYKLSEVPVNINLPKPHDIEDELLAYVDVLLGRVPSPVSSPYLSLAEVASAYYARALEIDMLIHMEERIGTVTRAHPLYKVRTGPLRSFIEMSKKMADLGSRRLTQEQLLYEMRHDSGL